MSVPLFSCVIRGFGLVWFSVALVRADHVALSPPFLKYCNLLAQSEKDLSYTPFLAQVAIHRITVVRLESGSDVSLV